MLFSDEIVEREQLPPGEYYALTLFAISGMMLMAAATDLLVIFLALEVLSLSVYVLTGHPPLERRRRRSGVQVLPARRVLERLLPLRRRVRLRAVAVRPGSTSSAPRCPHRARGEPSTMALLAIGLLIVGFAFKISAVPFHMWTPDAYEGAPTIVTAFMSTGVKAAAFAAFVRVFLSPLEPLQDQWIPVLGVIAGATMILGTVVGVRADQHQADAGVLEHRARRLPAARHRSPRPTPARRPCCSTCWPTPSRTSARSASWRCSGTAQHEHDELRDFAGLWKSRPGLAALMTMFLLSLGGFPPMAGFIGKWYIFSAAVERGHYWLAIIGVLTSVVSVFFYLRIVVMMYMTEGTDIVRPRVPLPAAAGLALATIAVFYLGILPTKIIELALDSISTIF